MKEQIYLGSVTIEAYLGSMNFYYEFFVDSKSRTFVRAL